MTNELIEKTKDFYNILVTEKYLLRFKVKTLKEKLAKLESAYVSEVAKLDFWYDEDKFKNKEEFAKVEILRNGILEDSLKNEVLEKYRRTFEFLYDIYGESEAFLYNIENKKMVYEDNKKAWEEGLAEVTNRHKSFESQNILFKE